MTPKEEIIDYFNRLSSIGVTEASGFGRASITKVRFGVWALRRETRSKDVTIVAFNEATRSQPLYGRWYKDRHIYDYSFNTYIADQCEGELLLALRAAFILEDLSRV